MDVLVTDPWLKRRLLRGRRARDVDRFDEVWNGVYILAAPFDNDHQRLVAGLSFLLHDALGRTGSVDVRLNIVVSDREHGWRRNYRIPDVALRYHDSVSRIRETHWLGGPDFLIEVVSRGDRSRKKRPFYAKIGVREMMVVDRDPWAVELYRLDEGELKLVGKSTVEDSQPVASEVVPLAFRLVAGDPTPRIEVEHREDGRSWLV